MLPARCVTPVEQPLRALFLFVPNGKKMDDWWPHGRGDDVKPSYLLEPLAPVWDRVTVFSGLCIDGGFSQGDGPGDHARASASFLTCAHPKKTGGADIRAGTSVDQVIAQRFQGSTRLDSLELGMERGSRAGTCDSGYSCAYSNNLSWRSPTTPIAKETNPWAVFERLFGDPKLVGNAKARQHQRDARVSVLDSVLDDAKALRTRLGAKDRSKIDDYLTSVRQLERRLERAAVADRDAVAKVPPLPEGLRPRGMPYPERLELMYEMLALAFAADLTRVASLMLGNAGSNRSYRFLGVPQGHHSLSHHKNDPTKLAAIRKINRFQMEQFGVFLQRLQAEEDHGGDLLANSLIVYGSGLSDGNRHNHDKLPVVLAGGGAGAVRGGRHVVLPARTPMANLYLAVQQTMGVDTQKFADSTGPLSLI